MAITIKFNEKYVYFGPESDCIRREKHVRRLMILQAPDTMMGEIFRLSHGMYGPVIRTIER